MKQSNLSSIPANNENSFWNVRNIIALGISLLILLATFGVAAKVLLSPAVEGVNGLDFIAQTLLPLWATWIGIILAFYFTRENFEAASKSYQSIIKSLTPEEKMASLPVTDVMLPVKIITHLTSPADLKKTLFDILADKRFISYNRFAVFTEQKTLFKMIHRSSITQFISDMLKEKKKPEEIETCTLDYMLQNASSEIRSMLDRGFNFVAETATLLDAKRVMESSRECMDVFVTKTGDPKEPVLGLVTNNKILEYARV